MKLNIKTWWWSLRKNSQLVIRLGVALVLLGLAFRLLSSGSNQFSSVTETPFLEKTQVQSSLNVPGRLIDQFHQKGIKVSIFIYGVFSL